MGRPSTEAGAREELRALGLRATPARLAVLAVLRHADAPRTHAEIVADLEDEGWDPATIFRNLTTLVERGFARRYDLGDHVYRFEAVQPGPPQAEEDHHHPHFLCTGCGDVQCIPQLELKPGAATALPRAITNRRVEIQVRGLCDRCSA